MSDPHAQKQSPFFRLPGEIRNKIYHHVLTTGQVIVDPIAAKDGVPPKRSSHHHIPNLGLSILRICRRVHEECHQEQLYTGNRFRFTTLTDAHSFLRSIGSVKAALLRDVELDLFSAQHKTTAHREWSRYLAWLAENGVWTRNIVQLQKEAPGLKTLRLDVGRDVVWTFLEGTLRGIAGLDRIAVTGQAEPSCCAAWELSDSWAWDFCRPLNFSGKPRSEPHVIDLMLKCVDGENESKLVQWQRDGRQVTLDVMRLRYKAWCSASLTDFTGRTRLPAVGACHYADYELHRQWKIDYI